MGRKIEKTSEGEIEAFLSEHPSWSVVEGKLHREFLFDDFVQAFGFMAQVAVIAERMDHHPEWSNVYNRVVVDLVTHDAGGITNRDFELADKMDTAAST